MMGRYGSVVSLSLAARAASPRAAAALEDAAQTTGVTPRPRTAEMVNISADPDVDSVSPSRSRRDHWVCQLEKSFQGVDTCVVHHCCIRHAAGLPSVPAGPRKLHTDDEALLLHICGYSVFLHVEDNVMGSPDAPCTREEEERATCERRAGRRSLQSMFSAATHLYSPGLP